MMISRSYCELLSLLSLLLLPLVTKASSSSTIIRTNDNDPICQDILSCTDGSGSVTPDPDTINHGQALMDWLRSKEGGFFNSKLDIRMHDGGFYGMFAQDKIPKGELLLEIPRDNVLTPGPPQVGDRVEVEFQEEDDEEEDEDREVYSGRITAVHNDDTYDILYDDGDKGRVDRESFEFEGFPVNCATVHRLIHEMKLGDDSQFAAYVNYLKSQPSGQLPSTWSEAGLDLLFEVLDHKKDGQALPPIDVEGWIEEDWHGRCRGGDDQLSHNAYMSVIQRSWDEALIPVYDMMSHRNGKWLNSESDPVLEGKSIKVRASRDIEAGEEIYTTYNFCIDCEGRAFDYGTPEILRDYGFVEDYPQRWIFSDENGFDLDETVNDDGSTKLEVNWIRGRAPSEEGVVFLREQLQRLKGLTDTHFEAPDPAVPKHEWDVISQYHQALIVAMTHAIEAAVGKNEEKCEVEGTCGTSSDRYDPLVKEVEEWSDERPATCDYESMGYNDWETLEEVKSPYQKIIFSFNEKMNDTCFDLDEVVIQICSSYAPQYHEMVVHYTARFIDTVKRVLFVGGGDSMLLRDIVKYPSLELVVGLELDQQVTRGSFKYFGTQPHWDNEKVEWWYGDATKSLLMLPKDYFGSFDMVLVDLSETVMALSVTDELDVMEALALLMKPEGILVKNEYMYFLEQSAIFQHTLHVHYYDVPVVCSQSLILASNSVNFLRGDVKDHKVDYIYDLLGNDRYGIMHDYQKNSTLIPTHCKQKIGSEKEPTKQERSPGILMIVEAEDSSSQLQPSETFKQKLVSALEKEGLTVVSSLVSDDKGSVVVVILREGYVVARTWPDQKYCALDIHLWSSFEKQEGVKKALTAAVGSRSGSSSSSYRIVAGGMFGVSTWKNDEKNRGPHLSGSCDRPVETVRNQTADESSVNAVLEETMNLVKGEDAVVAVVCGHQGQPCKSVELLEKVHKIPRVIALWTCPDLHAGIEDAKGGTDRIFDCEKDVWKYIKNSVTAEKQLRAIVVDSSAPFAMAQLVFRIFSSPRNAKRWFADNALILAPVLDEKEVWRRVFVDKFRKDIFVHEPVFTTEVLFNTSKSSFDLAITSYGDEDFVHRLVNVTASIEKDTGLVSDIRNIRGGEFDYTDEFEPSPSHIFKHSDYNLTSPLEQWSLQQPLGYQTIFQLEGEGKKVSISTAQVTDALKTTLSLMGFDIAASAKLQEYTEAGDGYVIAALWSGGNAIVLWDGRTHVDINLFTYAESEEFADNFLSHFTKQLSTLKMTLRDVQPRGIGRVVNFLKDIEPRGDPHWAK